MEQKALKEEKRRKKKEERARKKKEKEMKEAQEAEKRAIGESNMVGTSDDGAEWKKDDGNHQAVTGDAETKTDDDNHQGVNGSGELKKDDGNHEEANGSAELKKDDGNYQAANDNAELKKDDGNHQGANGDAERKKDGDQHGAETAQNVQENTREEDDGQDVEKKIIRLAETVRAILILNCVLYVPVFLLAFLSLCGVPIPAAAYWWFVILVLPLCSAINPILYLILSVDCKGKPPPDMTSSEAARAAYDRAMAIMRM